MIPNQQDSLSVGIAFGSPETSAQSLAYVAPVISAYPLDIPARRSRAPAVGHRALMPPDASQKSGLAHDATAIKHHLVGRCLGPCRIRQMQDDAALVRVCDEGLYNLGIKDAIP